MYTYKPATQTNKQKKDAIRALALSTSFRALLIAGIVGFGILYVLQMTTLSTKGFAITDLQRKLTTLKHQDRELTVKIAEFRSMHSVQKRLLELDMVPIDKITYIDVGGRAVAFVK